MSKMSKYLNRTVILFVVVLSLERADAKDLGVYGKTYGISEPSIKEEIERKLKIHESSGQLEEFNEKYKKAVSRQIKEPNRVVGIADAKENKTRKFDPTTELEEDIIVPNRAIAQSGVQIPKASEGGEEYQVLYKAGTKINPLKYMKFNEPLIFVDGRKEEQLEFARDYHDKNPLSKIILIDGKVGEKEINDKSYYYFFDQWGAYSSRFNISNVPSIVYQVEGEEVLTIDEVRLRKTNNNNLNKEIIYDEK